MTVGFAICGSFCTHARVLRQFDELCKLYDVIPILSEISYSVDTRFGDAEALRTHVETQSGHSILHSIAQTEPIGPKKLLDLLVIAPCTGNTLAKLASGVTDSAVTMAAKAQLRNERPVVLAVSSNDGLYTAAKNIGELLCRRHLYFVPFGQDDPVKKPRSLVAAMELLPQTVEAALRGEQIQPMLV